MRRRIIKFLIGVLCFVALGAAFFILYTLGGPGPYVSPRDSRIVSAIAQARAVISYVYVNEGNYDNFHCGHEEMKAQALCERIDENYGPKDNKEPIIAHDTVDNSQAACIYSPLNTKKRYWYCAHTKEGREGYTSIDPGSPGYCVEGESAVCPPLLKDIP